MWCSEFQQERRAADPVAGAAIDAVLKQLELCAAGQRDFTIVVGTPPSCRLEPPPRRVLLMLSPHHCAALVSLWLICSDHQTLSSPVWCWFQPQVYFHLRNVPVSQRDSLNHSRLYSGSTVRSFQHMKTLQSCDHWPRQALVRLNWYTSYVSMHNSGRRVMQNVSRCLLLCKEHARIRSDT